MTYPRRPHKITPITVKKKRVSVSFSENSLRNKKSHTKKLTAYMSPYQVGDNARPQILTVKIFIARMLIFLYFPKFNELHLLNK